MRSRSTIWSASRFVDGERLVGVLARPSCSAASPRTSFRPRRLAAGCRRRPAAARLTQRTSGLALRRLRELRCRQPRSRAGCPARSPRARLRRVRRSPPARPSAPATITGARSGSTPGTCRRSSRVRAASRCSCSSTAPRELVAVHGSRSYASRPRSSAASVVTVAATPTTRFGAVVGRRLRHARRSRRRPRRSAPSYAPTPTRGCGAVRGDDLGRAAADIDHSARRSSADPAKGQPRLLLAGQQLGREAVAPLDLAQERLAVLRVSDGARPDGRARARRPATRARGGTRRERSDTRDRQRQQSLALVDAFAEAGDRGCSTTSSTACRSTSATSRRVVFVPRSRAATRIYLRG